MQEFIFKGTLSLDGVTFYITAENEAEAESKAMAGEFDDYDTNCAGSTDWKINPASLELNE